MALVDDNDVNVHLPTDKISAEENDLKEDIYEDAERIIRGNLAGFIDAVEMATWTTPENTPDIIRAIGGRLCAAFIYRRRYSEDSLDDPQYPQLKYNEAMNMIMAIQQGNLTVDDLPPSALDFTLDYFYPNDPGTQPPKFTIDSVY